MSNYDREDPFANFAFRVEIDGIEMFAFTEVSGLSNNTDIYEYQEGGENQFTHKLVGQTTFANIVLKHGITTDSGVYEWRQKVIEGRIRSATKNGTIKLKDPKTNKEKSWRFYNAWPCKLEVEPLNSSADKIAIGMIELAVERVEEA
jgi:phage tail-like protein